MRQECTIQASLFDVFAGHEIGRELKATSAWLDARPGLGIGVAERSSSAARSSGWDRDRRADARRAGANFARMIDGASPVNPRR